MLLPDTEGGGDPNRIPLLTKLHQCSHVDRRADIGVDRASQQLKWIPVDRAELDLPGLLVECLVDTGMEHHLIQTHLSGHAAGHLTFALQQYGFYVVQDHFTFRRIWRRESEGREGREGKEGRRRRGGRGGRFTYLIGMLV